MYAVIQARGFARQAFGRLGGAGAGLSAAAAQSAAREALLLLALNASPVVEDTAPGLVTLDLSGHGTRDACVDALAGLPADARALGIDVCIGIATTPGIALFAARAAGNTTCRGDGCDDAPPPLLVVDDPARFLDATPPEVALLPDDTLQVLRQWGIRSLGRYGRLPRAEVARRLGAVGAQLWDQVHGRDARLLRRWSPAPRHLCEMEFEHPVESLEALMFVARRLLEQLCLKLSWSCKYARGMRLELGFEDGARHARDFDLPEPTRDPDLLFDALHLHLEQLRAEAAIVRLVLELQPVDPPQLQGGLFDAGVRDAWRFAATHAQLVGLVGDANVGSPRLLDSLRPDAWRREPLPRRIEPLDEGACPLPVGLALRRLRPPPPVQVWLDARGVPTVLCSGSGTRLQIATARGPYRSSSHWWERGLFWRRTEWDVATEDGRICRIFETDAAWYCEGFYG